MRFFNMNSISDFLFVIFMYLVKKNLTKGRINSMIFSFQKLNMEKSTSSNEKRWMYVWSVRNVIHMQYYRRWMKNCVCCYSCLVKSLLIHHIFSSLWMIEWGWKKDKHKINVASTYTYVLHRIAVHSMQ